MIHTIHHQSVPHNKVKWHNITIKGANWNTRHLSCFIRKNAQVSIGKISSMMMLSNKYILYIDELWQHCFTKWGFLPTMSNDNQKSLFWRFQRSEPFAREIRTKKLNCSRKLCANFFATETILHKLVGSFCIIMEIAYN